MKAVSTKTYTVPYAHEDENFWRKHISDFSDSGLTKKSYCSQAEINYARFFHWIKKLSPFLIKTTKHTARKEKSAKTVMLPVRLKQASETIKPNLLCTLHLKNGCVLHIRDPQALCLVLEKWC